MAGLGGVIVSIPEEGVEAAFVGVKALDGDADTQIEVMGCGSWREGIAEGVEEVCWVVGGEGELERFAAKGCERCVFFGELAVVSADEMEASALVREGKEGAGGLAFVAADQRKGGFFVIEGGADARRIMGRIGFILGQVEEMAALCPFDPVGLCVGADEDGEGRERHLGLGEGGGGHLKEACLHPIADEEMILEAHHAIVEQELWVALKEGIGIGNLGVKASIAIFDKAASL